MSIDPDDLWAFLCGAKAMGLSLHDVIGAMRPHLEPDTSVIVRRGRPRLGEKRPKPWVDAGMSRATWYRRKAERERSTKK